MASKKRYKAILRPDVLMNRSLKKSAEVGQENKPLGPVFVCEETWFLARAEACKLLQAGYGEFQLIEETEST